jgi:hypothetical protein
MTKEAFSLYFHLLKADGALAIHLTNRYIDLNPIVDAQAANYHKRATHIHSQAHPDQHILDADWVVISGTAHASVDRRLQQPLPGPQIAVPARFALYYRLEQRI